MMEQIEASNSKWLIREASPKDLPFIYASWLDNYYTMGLHPDYFQKEFNYTYSKLFDVILLNSKTIVACLPTSKDTVLGFLCHDTDYLHYIFIKEDFRGFGIAKDLYNQTNGPIDCTFATVPTKHLRQRLKLKYTPLNLTKYLLKLLKQGEQNG